jgi:hypothetical protein
VEKNPSLGSDISKSIIRRRTGYKGPEGEQSYRSTFSLTSALGGNGLLTSRCGRFTREKETRCLLYRRMGGPRTGLDGCEKSRPYRDSIPGQSSS